MGHGPGSQTPALMGWLSLLFLAKLSPLRPPITMMMLFFRPVCRIAQTLQMAYFAKTACYFRG